MKTFNIYKETGIRLGGEVGNDLHPFWDNFVEYYKQNRTASNGENIPLSCMLDKFNAKANWIMHGSPVSTRPDQYLIEFETEESAIYFMLKFS